MYKKTIFPLHACWLFVLAMILFMGGSGIYVIVASIIVNLYHDFFIIIVIFTIAIFVYFVMHLKFRVVFHTDHIFIPNDEFLPVQARIQYEVKIYYNEIAKIDYVEDHKNSKRQPINSIAVSSFLPKPFLE